MSAQAGTPVAASAGRAVRDEPGGGRTRPRLAWLIVAAPAAVVLFACYLGQSRTVAVGSDGASQALQGWDMLHGNLLMHGWWVGDVPLYTTEIPQYALLEAVRGLHADVIHVAGAMTYTLLVLAAAFLGRGRATGPAGVSRALLAAGIMLAPQLAGGTQTLVLSPDHTGTGVPLLLIFLLIDRSAPRWHVPVLVFLGLAATALADAITVFVAVIPLAVCCAVQVGAGVAVRRERLAAHWYPAALGAAALLAVPAELVAAALLRALGGWQVNPLSTALASAGQLAGNARLAGAGLLELFGADFFVTAPGIATVLAVVHLAGVLLALAGVLAAARRFPRLARGNRGTGPGGDLIPAVLLAGGAIDLASYLAGVQAVNLASTREIAPVLPFAAVLAARFLGDWLVPAAAGARAGARHRGTHGRPRGTDQGGTGRSGPGPGVPRARTVVRRGLYAVLAVYACGLGYAAVQPPAAPQYADLAAWLRAHHLTNGLSGYHQANIVSLETGGAVTLRALVPVRGAAGGHPAGLVGYAWNSSSGWFDPARHAATFVVAAAPGEPGGTGPSIAQAVATFGRPVRTYRYETYAILVWPRGTNLLARLKFGQSGAAAGSK